MTAMTATRCQLCGTPVEDAAVCYLCIEGDANGENIRRRPALARDLGDVAALVPSLVVSYTRQGRTGQRVGGRGWDKPVPWDDRARIAAHELRNELATTVRLLDLGDADDDPTSPALAAWLLCRLERIRHHAAAAEIVRGIHRAVEHARRAVDLPPDRWYAGQCRDEYRLEDGGDVCCTVHLYAEPEHGKVTCPGCGAIFDVGERKRWLLAVAHDQLATTTVIARAVTVLGAASDSEGLAAKMRKWVERHRLFAKSVDLQGRPLYRVGDVLDLLSSEASATARKARTA